MRISWSAVIVTIAMMMVAYVAGGYTFGAVQKAVGLKPVATEQNKIKLPANMVKISGCIPFEGEHWVAQKDTPHGPYYVTYNGKLMALEYMFTQEDIVGEKYAKMSPDQLIAYMQTNKLDLKGLVNEVRSFNFDTFGAEVKYFDIHWTSPHAGEITPHYDMHLYLQDRATMNTVCPESGLQDVFSDDVMQGLQKSGIALPK